MDMNFSAKYYKTYCIYKDVCVCASTMYIFIRWMADIHVASVKISYTASLLSCRYCYTCTIIVTRMCWYTV